MTDPALETLFLAVAEAPPARRPLFLRARDGVAFALWRATHGKPVCEQGFKPHADVLMQAGIDVVSRVGDKANGFDQVWLLPPRQRVESRADLVRALRRAAPGARIVASVANDEGARSAESDFKALFGAAGSLSKHRCRAFWTDLDPARVDTTLADAWTDAAAPQRIADGRYLSRPGVFAWDRIDAASALLAAHLPVDLAGHGADLGSGYGYLASEVARRCAGVAALDLYEAQAMALDLARENLAEYAPRIAFDFRWHDVARGLSRRYDFVVTNPPFHATGRADLPELGQAFVRAAAAALRPGGRLLLVANRHLPYERTLAEHFATRDVLADEQGFKVIGATKGAA
ncbi:class I SAM-dependent methyltransferase [Tahibacter soli]|uniref:Methyltransferase n=1 Tax=Tahibacter soli TaxID=2983605 RepID=A0A9X3YKA9_9GAMM|nr:methyltransferase [Tahibacter soli]MDC8012353.1 methyltransferase [Tahibacter soli]